MKDHRPPRVVLDRLHANLQAVGITLSASDLDGILASGMLANVVEFEAAVAGVPVDTVPEMADTNPPDPPAAPPARDAEAGTSGNSIADLAPRLRSGAVSPVELLEQCLARIAAREIELNAFQTVLVDRARLAAKRAELAIHSRDWRGPLHGIPIAVKDLYAMAGTVATAGSLLRDRPDDFDAAVVERLQQAGAVIVGKTRMPEFAYSPGSNNPHFGPTSNPHDLSRDAGGSSSGSGAAVADGMALAAIGSDTGGSIRIPAANCGAVGLKPTFGRVSLHGAIPLAWSLDHAGPITTTVADAALVLEAIAGPDPRDPRTQRAPRTWQSDLAGGVRVFKVGVLVNPAVESIAGSEAVAVWRRTLASLERSGAALRDVTLREFDALRVVNYAILAAEAGAYHEADLRSRPELYGDFCRQRLLAGFAYGPQSYARARQARAGLSRRALSVFDGVDALVLPAMPEPAPVLGVPSSVRFTSPFNALGWPAVVVPAGETASSLPLAVQVVARPWDENTALRVALAVEQTRPASPPRAPETTVGRRS